ncbi:MAG: hypothetical protein V3S45_08930, partial [Kiloniellales bacterium]
MFMVRSNIALSGPERSHSRSEDRSRAMTWRTKLTAGAGAAFLTLAGAGSASPDEPPYPVWWSPVLELESLDAIDARLERLIWPDYEEGLLFYSGSGANLVEAWANSCASLKKLTEAGYFGGGSPGIWLQHYQLSLCEAIEALESAAPANVSFLRDFTFDVESVNHLPAMVNLSPSCDFICREMVANDKGIPLSRFDDVLLRQVISDTEIDIWTAAWQVRLTILARGDFNADGVDDMLVLSSGGATEGTYAA